MCHGWRFVRLILAVAATAAAALACPAAAQTNQAPVIDSIAFSPSPVPASSTSTITCSAHDVDGSIVAMRVVVTGGTLPGGGTSGTPSFAPGPSVAGTIAWTTPAAGSYQVTCRAQDDGAFPQVGALTVNVSVVASTNAAPVIDAFSGTDVEVLPGGSIRFTVTARDPDGDPLAFAWSATFGAVTGTGATADWSGPSSPGSGTVTVTVSDPASATATEALPVRVVLARFEGSVPSPLRAPRRIAVGPYGDVYVVDAATGELWLFTPRGEPKGRAALGDTVLGVAAAGDRVFVSTAEGRIRILDPATGRLKGDLAVQGPALARPVALAWHPGSSLLLVAERDAGRVRAARADGSVAFTVAARGATGAPLGPLADVAVDRASGRIWVLEETDEAAESLHAYDAAGAWLVSTASFGGGAGQLTRGSGLAVDGAGRVYAADAFQGRVAVYETTGAPVGSVGDFGDGEGQLRSPAGLAVLASGNLLVANVHMGRVDVFGGPAPWPTCPGDTDCDGMPDAWELAFGLNPTNPADALGDKDGDGLLNVEEYALRTDPTKADSDGDGFADGVEVAQGYDPLDPTDHRTVLVAGPPVTTGPGLVRLKVRLVGKGSCQVAYTQTKGPPVLLRDAATLTPSFIARTAGLYRFQVVAACPDGKAAPVTLSATVLDVAPRSVAVGPSVVEAGGKFGLDGRWSWDANAGPLRLAWDQTLGVPLMGTQVATRVDLKAKVPGLYQFELSATDPAGHAGTEALTLLAVPAGMQAPTAFVVEQVEAHVGDVVALDATSSLGVDGKTIEARWSQVAGPTVALAGAGTLAASFTPTQAGHYAFDVFVGYDRIVSPPARVAAWVAEAGATLPRAAAQAPVSAIVGEPFELDGRASQAAGAFACRWRQVSGPAAGLTGADGCVATVVPFAAGTLAFELEVLQGTMVGPPARVVVEADEPGQPRPTARVKAPGAAWTRKSVRLDGQASASPSAAPLSYRWRQVAGPWVPIEDAEEAVATVVPLTQGVYAFELTVDDGIAAGTPAVAHVLVFAKVDGP